MSGAVDIEIALHSSSSISKSSWIAVVEKYLEGHKVRPNSIISNFSTEGNTFSPLVKSIIIGNISNMDTNEIFLDLKAQKVNWFVYTMDSDGPTTHTEADEEGEEVTLATHLVLPSKELFTLWENLYYDNNIKEKASKLLIT